MQHASGNLLVQRTATMADILGCARICHELICLTQQVWLCANNFWPARLSLDVENPSTPTKFADIGV